MSKYQCCGTTMLVAPSVSLDGSPQITRLCMFCELRYIVVPEQRTSSENDAPPAARPQQTRPGLALQRPWSQPAEVREAPFEPAGVFIRLKSGRSEHSSYSLLARVG